MWFSERSADRPASLADLAVDRRIRLRREVDRTPAFRADAGRTGAITEILELVYDLWLKEETAPDAASPAAQLDPQGKILPFRPRQK